MNNFGYNKVSLFSIPIYICSAIMVYFFIIGIRVQDYSFYTFMQLGGALILITIGLIIDYIHDEYIQIKLGLEGKE